MVLLYQSTRFFAVLLVCFFVGLGTSLIKAQASTDSNSDDSVQEVTLVQQTEIQERLKSQAAHLQMERANLPRREGVCTSSPASPMDRKGKASLTGQVFVPQVPKQKLNKLEGGETK